MGCRCTQLFLNSRSAIAFQASIVGLSRRPQSPKWPTFSAVTIPPVATEQGFCKSVAAKKFSDLQRFRTNFQRLRMLDGEAWLEPPHLAQPETGNEILQASTRGVVPLSRALVGQALDQSVNLVIVAPVRKRKQLGFEVGEPCF